jgi:hypothetical protein
MTGISPQVTAIFVTIVGLIVGFVIQYFAVIMRLEERFSDALSQMKERISAVETKMDLFWNGVKDKVINLLKSYPTYIEKDVLLDKMAHDELTLDEAQKLRTILTAEMDSDPDKSTNSWAYVLALGWLAQLIHSKSRSVNTDCDNKNRRKNERRYLY